jgi:hypothetical protein
MIRLMNNWNNISDERSCYLNKKTGVEVLPTATAGNTTYDVFSQFTNFRKRNECSFG